MTAISRKPETSKVMSIGQIEQLYPQEWVAIEITRDAKREQSIRGRLIAHSPDRGAVTPQHVRFRDEHPGVVTFEFYTTPPVEPPEGVTFVL